MIKANIFEVKARLSELLARVEHGETVVICKRNRPLAELRRIASARTESRPIGGLEGAIEILPSFFDPLPDELLDSFDGGRLFPTGTRAAESRAVYGTTNAAAQKRDSRGRRRR